MNFKIKIIGRSGQGIKKLANILMRSALLENKYYHITLTSAYDAVVRGGISTSRLTVSENYIDNPVFKNEEADIIINTDLMTVRRQEERAVQVNKKISEKNKAMFLLGIAINLKRLEIKKELLEVTLKNIFKGDVLERNIKTLNEGIEFGENTQI